MRIFPEMCASTLCPFSSSTRNMAFGNGSTTVPSTRIMSSLGLTRASHHLNAETESGPVRFGGRSPRIRGLDRGRAERAFGRPVRIPEKPPKRQTLVILDAPGSSREGQDDGAVLGDGDAVLEMRSSAAVGGHHGPAVVEE